MTEKHTAVNMARIRAHRREWTALANDDLRDAKHVQRSTVFYLVAASIVLLGVAFETAPLGQHAILDIGELTAWAVLVISAGAGLYYVRRLPNVYLKGVQETSARGQAEEGELYKAMGAESLSIGGETVPVEDYIVRKGEQAQGIAAATKTVEVTMTRVGKLQFWSFVIGLVLLGMVRGGPAAVDVIGELASRMGM